MKYDNELIDSDGEVFPYSALVDEDGYHYKISVVCEDEDGELHILNEGIHLEFDSGDWLEFLIPPPTGLFPKKKELSEDDLLKVLSFLASDSIETKRHSVKDIDLAYERYKRQTT